MTKLQDTVVSFFKDNGWNMIELESKNTWKIPFSGRHGKWDCYARVRESQQQFVFYSILPTKVARHKCIEIASLISKINYGLIIGNFELDLNDGEIRCKTSIDVTNDRLSIALVKSLVFTNVAIVDKYLPEFMDIINSNEAFIENQPEIDTP